MSLVSSMELEKQIVSLCPEAEVEFKEGRFHVTGKTCRSSEEKCESDYQKSQKWLDVGGTKYYYCDNCNGQDHEQYGKILSEVKHTLHPKHPLQLVYLRQLRHTKQCYCCEKRLAPFFYYCPVCEFCMNIGCVNKTTHFSIDHPKKHEHILDLFPRQNSLTCNLCALNNSEGPIYMCPPCDLVVHKSCLNLPSVIKISRHRHRISFKLSFVWGDRSCGVCRRMINSDYGGFSCNKEGCSYTAHSKCATRKNVWDGIELEGKSEDADAIDDERDPYVTEGDGIIRHFRHAHHCLRLDEDIHRVYDENRRCQACIMPIYHDNFYSCMKCEFILHETCANLARTEHHAMHPHPLKLVSQYDNRFNPYNACSACYQPCTGFMYKCHRRRCNFKLHIQCATVPEPLHHESHMDHPLFLTSEPGERRLCRICKSIKETFNCIECDYSLCFICAILPHKVKYKHDEHFLFLSYGEDITAKFWCEVCESQINPEERFYSCEECCVTLHIECLVGKNLYIKPGSYVCHKGEKIDVLLNDRMSRPSCTRCTSRCEDKLVFQYVRTLSFCSLHCFVPSLLNLR